MKFRMKILIPLVCSACSYYETPPLPDLNAKSFSYEEIMESKKKLKIKSHSTREENTESSN
ncbi:MAG: hypothetical protein LBT67_01680 [Holosporaceae bacterium]|jgi:hypothetical protein|nr:hypothetical protein [Holosporaceae bacterium]